MNPLQEKCKLVHVLHMEEDHSNCKYKITIRLDSSHVVQTATEDGSGRGLKSKARAKWYVDSHQDYMLDEQRRNFVSSCFSVNLDSHKRTSAV